MTSGSGSLIPYDSLLPFPDTDNRVELLRKVNTLSKETRESQWNELEARTGKSYHYITYELGEVLNDHKDGKSHSFTEPYDYISYRSVEEAEPGDTVLTYFVWCNNCNECDDMIERYDVVLE